MDARSVGDKRNARYRLGTRANQVVTQKRCSGMNPITDDKCLASRQGVLELVFEVTGQARAGVSEFEEHENLVRKHKKAYIL